MFKIQIISLLKEYESSNDENKENIQNKIQSLVNDNLEEWENFCLSGTIDNSKIELVQKILTASKKELKEENKTEEAKEDEDVKKIKLVYLKWLESFEANSYTLTNEMSDLIVKTINFYITNRFDVLLKILEIDMDENFEKFKNHLRNEIRKYIANKVLNYMETDKYKNLGFFKKREENNKIEGILNENSDYNFKNINLSELN